MGRVGDASLPQAASGNRGGSFVCLERLPKLISGMAGGKLFLATALNRFFLLRPFVSLEKVNEVWIPPLSGFCADPCRDLPFGHFGSRKFGKAKALFRL